MLKFSLLLLMMAGWFAGKAQKVESIYVNLYTDSLKKGTYNYINVDGLLSNGKYIPLNNTQVCFTSSHGEFNGNSLWIDSSMLSGKVLINVKLIADTSNQKSFEMYIKTKKDEDLKTEQEILDEMKQQQKKKKKN